MCLSPVFSLVSQGLVAVVNWGRAHGSMSPSMAYYRAAGSTSIMWEVDTHAVYIQAWHTLHYPLPYRLGMRPCASLSNVSDLWAVSCIFIQECFLLTIMYSFLFTASGKSSPPSDFCKRLGTFLSPRVSQLARDIDDFVTKSKATRYYTHIETVRKA